MLLQILLVTRYVLLIRSSTLWVTIYCSQGDDHAARMARFAIAAAEVAGETLVDSGNLSSGTVKIRIGLHSGPVTACVLGQNIPK